MAKVTKDEIMKAVEEMTVLELADLVKALEEKFGVSAAPMAVAAPAAAGAHAGEPPPDQTTSNAMLTSAGPNKISVIKAVRELVPTL